MAVTAIIPARMASTRFPGKALAAETGKTLVQHVYERAARASLVGRVVVASDSDEIGDAVRAFGGEHVLTGEHPNGASRLAEAAATLGLPPSDTVVNVQGDEPEIDPAIIDLAIRALPSDENCPVSTVASPFAPGEDPANPNIVKALVAATGRALCFTRSLVPFDRDGTGGPAKPLKHVGLYVYRRGFLDTYLALAPTPLELTEKLEQLRVLEHGYQIAVAVAETSHTGIDTPEQYAEFVRRFRSV